jgi:hypothetical protein
MTVVGDLLRLSSSPYRTPHEKNSTAPMPL